MALDISEGVGHSFLSDNSIATNLILQTKLGQKLKEKGICYHRYLTDREYYKGKEEGQNIYNHWQQSFLTEDPMEAEKIAREKQLEVEWGPNR